MLPVGFNNTSPFRDESDSIKQVLLGLPEVAKVLMEDSS